jgi:hypothetical protein
LILTISALPVKLSLQATETDNTGMLVIYSNIMWQTTITIYQ